MSGPTEPSQHAPSGIVDTTPAWSWRKAEGGWWLGDDRWITTPKGRTVHRVFHAYDINDNAACDAMAGLAASVEQPNEGSELCSQCLEVVRTDPMGRPKRVYS